MSHVRVSKGGGGETKIRTVPIAVTPEGFWCCPSPVVFQKNLKTHTHHHHHVNKPKHPPPSPPRPPPQPQPPSSVSNKKQPPSSAQNPTKVVTQSDDPKSLAIAGSPAAAPSMAAEERSVGRSKVVENLPKKVSLEFGESGTSDMKVVLIGKHGFSVKLNVHKSVLVGKSSFFAEKLVGEQELCDVASLKIYDCDDIDIYVETVGLMYSKDMKHRLLKQSVERVLRILKVAEILGFSSCIQTCLDYLEAAPWVGEEEEEKVVSSVMRLQSEGGFGGGVNPVLKRVSSKTVTRPPKDTLSHILELVLKSNEERGRREMKSIVLKLLRENSCSSDTDNSPDLCYETINASCRSCLDSLLAHFKQATGPTRAMDSQDPLAKQIAIESDNLAWLLEILAERQVADEFALMWVRQQELATLHQKLPTMIRYHISCITARLFVGIGRGELLPSKETRHMLLQTWLEPLTNDYSWLNHGCRSFDRKVVEEGIGRTILTLPLEDQQSILLSWLSTFLKSGDNCPNLQRAFEVWWRRTFIRPYAEPRVYQG